MKAIDQPMWRTAFHLVLLGAITLTGAARAMRSMRAEPPAAPASADDVDAAAVLRAMSGTSNSAARDKPWAVTFGHFVNAHPDRQWVVGRSHRPALSEPDAAEMAQVDAANQVELILRHQLHPPRRDFDWLRRCVLKDVRGRRFQVDRLAERFDRPYGAVWTESVLLDMSPDRLDPLVREYSRQMRTRHVLVRRRIVAGVVVVIAAWIAFLLINRITKGYFTTRLELVAAAVTAAVVLMV